MYNIFSHILDENKKQKHKQNNDEKQEESESSERRRKEKRNCKWDVRHSLLLPFYVCLFAGILFVVCHYFSFLTHMFVIKCSYAYAKC